MSNPAFTYDVDLNGDGSYTDISAYVMEGDWFLGFAGQYDPLCRDSTATITLKNADARFSPEHASVFSALWSRGLKLRIRSTDPADATVRQMWIGWIKPIKPVPGTKGSRRAVVQCTGWNDRAMDAEAFVPIQQNKTADQIIVAAVAASGIYPPGLAAGRWLLGIPGASELGTTTTLGADSDWFTGETGKTTFSIMGDRWRDGVPVLNAVKDAAAQEYGRVWIDRNGVMQFINRHHLILDTTVDATFDNSMLAQGGFDYSFGDELYNQITVRARGRKVGSAPEVLGRIDKATLIGASTTLVLSFRYADLSNSGAKIAGQNAITPTQTTDFKANTATDGTGTDLTTSVTAAITNQEATRCEVTFTNAAVVPVYLQAGFQIRGTAIRDFGESDYVYTDTASTTAQKGKIYPLKYSATVDNLADAEGIARYIGTARSVPRGQSKSLSIPARASAANLTQCLTRTIFDRITAKEAQTGTNKDFFIISEHHHAGPGKNYACTWGIEPAAIGPGTSGAYWVLGVAGYSELGQTTYVGPF